MLTLTQRRNLKRTLEILLKGNQHRVRIRRQADQDDRFVPDGTVPGMLHGRIGCRSRSLCSFSDFRTKCYRGNERLRGAADSLADGAKFMSKREHRRFTAEQKIEILRESDQPGVTISEGSAMRTDGRMMRRRAAQSRDGANASGDRGDHGGEP